MSDIPMFSFFNDIYEECSLDVNESLGCLEINQSSDEYHSCSNLDDFPLNDFNISLGGSPKLYNDTVVSNTIFDLSDKAVFSSESHLVNSLNDKEDSLSFQCDTGFDNFEDSLLPSSLVEDTFSSLNYLENYSVSPHNLYDHSKELDLPEIIFNSEKSLANNSELEEESKSGGLTQDKLRNSSNKPITLVLKKFKREKNLNMVAPLDIPKPVYTLVRIPGENKYSKNVEVVTLKKIDSSESSNYSDSENENSTSKDINGQSFQNKASRKIGKHISSKDTIFNNAISCDEELGNINLKDLPFTSLKRKLQNDSNSKKSEKKLKAYELEPLPDPTLEKCRRNAINAKKNRDIKKEKMMKLEAEVEKIMQEKLDLAGENDTLKQKNLELEKKIKYLSSLLTNNQFKLSNVSNFNMKLQGSSKNINAKNWCRI